MSTPTKHFISPNKQLTPVRPSPYTSCESPKKPRINLSDYKNHLSQFHLQLETKCKAALYDLSIGDSAGASQELKQILNESKKFMGSSVSMLDDINLKNIALQQKSSTLQQFTNHLQMENKDLRRRLDLYTGFEACFDDDNFPEMTESATDETKGRQVKIQMKAGTDNIESGPDKNMGSGGDKNMQSGPDKDIGSEGDKDRQSGPDKDMSSGGDKDWQSGPDNIEVNRGLDEQIESELSQVEPVYKTCITIVLRRSLCYTQTFSSLSYFWGQMHSEGYNLCV